LSVRAGHVGVRGLRLTNSGDSHDGVDAGLLIEADHARVEGNTLDHVLFGIHLKQANHALVRGNTIRGRPAELNLRGDGIRLWNSRFNRIEGNLLDGIRDLTIANSVENLFSRNAIVNGRYGMQLVFSPRNRIEGNLVSHTTTGIAVLYSDQVTLRGNRVEHARDVAGAGLAFKGSGEALVAGNTLLHCTVGIQTDAPPTRRRPTASSATASPTTSPACISTARKAATSCGAINSSTTCMQVGVSGATSAREQRLAWKLLGRLPGLRPRR
jgi:nitrous oxidase accessory protein